MKKLFLSIVLLIVLIIAIALLIVINTPEFPYDKSIVKDNIEAYTEIADTVYNNYSQNYSDDVLCVYLINESNFSKITSITGQSPIQLDVRQQNCAKTVYDTVNLANQNLKFIFVTDSFVIFTSDGYLASFIYTPSGKKPDFVAFPDDGYKYIHTEKIIDNWYYSCREIYTEGILESIFG